MKKTLLTLALSCALFSPLFGEKTLAVIKPDAVKGNHIGAILDKYEQAQLKIVALKMVKLTPEQAKTFYAVHEGRPFFNDLTAFFSSGPVVAIVLEGDGAVLKNRAIMGATNPAQAEQGTIRKDFASSVTQNAVHGSDSKESAEQEIPFFFKAEEIN